MYVGRIVAVGQTKAGRVCAMYRVSSRSFPNREARSLQGSIAIVPKPGFEDDIKQNPFIAYSCLIVVDQFAVASNGSHTDFLATKLRTGAGIRDALISVLHACDYEPDSLSTPRIAAIVDRRDNVGYLGIVMPRSIHVQGFQLTPGVAYYVATYEHTVPGDLYKDDQFDCADAGAGCDYVLRKGVFATLERPVTAACALADDQSGFTIATDNAR